MNLYDLIDGLLTGVEKIKGKLTTGENWIQLGDFLIQWGTVQVSTPALGANKYGYVTITFQKRFSATPAIVAGSDIYGGYQSTIGISQQTAATFILSSFHNSPVNSANMSWIAIGPA